MSVHKAVYQTRNSALHHYYREQSNTIWTTVEQLPGPRGRLLLPLVDLVQVGLPNLLNSDAWLSFNFGDQLLVTLALILMEYHLRSTILMIVNLTCHILQTTIVQFQYWNNHNITSFKIQLHLLLCRCESVYKYMCTKLRNEYFLYCLICCSTNYSS